MLGLRMTRDDELLVFIDDLRIYFVPFWAELDSYNGIFLKKNYEPEPAFLPANCRVIFDCGANIGIYTLRAAAGGTDRVFSIEPNSLVFNRLERNIETNNITNITAINTGIGSAGGKARLYWGTSTLGGSIIPDGGQDRKSAIDVEIRTLDDIIDEYNIDSIDVMKMDVEKNEYEALLGADKTLNITKRLILEFHSDDLKNRCESLLISRGFRKVHEILEHQFYLNTSLKT